MTIFDRRKWRKGSVYAASFRPLDRNQRAAILFLAEALERRTHEPGRHGGVLGRTGLAVLRALVCQFHNCKSGQLDPSIASIAKAANVARSTAQEALNRLELCGLIDRTRRIIRARVRYWSEAAGRVVTAERVLQTSNAYRLNGPLPDRSEYGDYSAIGAASRAKVSDTGSRSGTTRDIFSKAEPGLSSISDPRLRTALERMQTAIARREVQALTA